MDIVYKYLKKQKQMAQEILDSQNYLSQKKDFWDGFNEGMKNAIMVVEIYLKKEK